MENFENSDVRVPINPDSLSITRDETKCILCGACRSVCKYGQGVYGRYDFQTQNRAICIECGQCSNVCPTDAIQEQSDYHHVKEAIQDPEKIVIFQTAPSIRVALGEAFGLDVGSFVEGKMIAALRKLGADYVLDTCVGADLTIMEEANELLERLEQNTNLPLYTSCCPAWVKFAEIFYPEVLPHLSTTKSPIAMLGAMIKTYFAKKMSLDPKKIINVAVTPCTAKKYEIKREEFHDVADYYGKEINEMDYVITTRELANWLKEENIDFQTLEESKFDSILGSATGSGLIFGASGGVLEAAIRTAYFYKMGEPLKTLELKAVRGIEAIKEATIDFGEKKLRVAVISGTNSMHSFLKMAKENQLSYDFVEVMACHGGCVAGGGQPKVDQTIQHLEKQKRASSLYQKEETLKKRCSYESEEMKMLYQEFLKSPGSRLSKQLLHTSYHAKPIKQKEIVSSSF